MSQFPTRQGVRGAVSQAAYFNSRERMRSLRDPTADLFKTTDLTRVPSVIDTDVLFPDADRELAFTVAMNVTPSSTGEAGVQLGSTSPLIFKTVAAGLEIRAGGPGVGDNVTMALLGVLNVDLFQRLTMSVLPGTGQVKVWVNGELLTSLQSANQTFNGPWSDGGDGSISVIAPDVLATVEAYVGQNPQQF